jgi:hypothetical protein
VAEARRPVLEILSPAAPAPTAPGVSAPLIAPAALDYGLLDSMNESRQQLTAALSAFADNLGKTLAKAVDDVATLNVSTYVSQDVAGAVTDPAQRELRAFTRVKLDGDTEVIVPRVSGKIDRELWDIHLSMVQQAQNNRAEMMKAAAAAATALLQAFKVI